MMHKNKLQSLSSVIIFWFVSRMSVSQTTVSAEKRCWTWWTSVSQPQGERILEVKQIKDFLLTRIKGDTGMSVLRMLSWEEFKVSLWHILNTVQGNVQLHCNLVSLTERSISPHSDIYEGGVTHCCSWQWYHFKTHHVGKAALRSNYLSKMMV